MERPTQHSPVHPDRGQQRWNGASPLRERQRLGYTKGKPRRTDEALRSVMCASWARAVSVSCRHFENWHVKELLASKYDPQCRAKCERVRGMLKDRFALGSFAHLPDLRSRRLLR
jgi:hypothetical protein